MANARRPTTFKEDNKFGFVFLRKKKRWCYPPSFAKKQTLCRFLGGRCRWYLGSRFVGGRLFVRLDQGGLCFKVSHLQAMRL